MMEFNEKLQELRKMKGLTQEELAQALYVSRTAISKWESGRGYPNIDSLKQISAFFGVSLDDLLSGEQLLDIAEEDTRQKTAHMQDVLFGLLDMSVAMFWVLPWFGQTADGGLQEVPLWALTAIAPHTRVAYWGVVVLLVLCGVSILALQRVRCALWHRIKAPVSLALTALGVLLFILGSQPYAAAYLFVLLAIETLIWLKRP